VSYSLFAFGTIGILLLLALAWLSFSRLRRTSEVKFGLRQEREWRHIAYLPQIKQALANVDLEFLSEHASPGLAKRVRKERRRIALNYLSALRTDFEKLLRFARVIAVMSPDLAVMREVQGLRLSIEFSYRYYLIYLRLLTGITPIDAIGNLSDMVSALTVQMEKAISDLGERAALAAELSPYNGRGMDAS
jgi:hypothetical protein